MSNDCARNCIFGIRNYYVLNNSIKAFLFDLDGVFYVDNQLIDGGNETLRYLRDLKIPFRFITNNTTDSRNNLTSKLIQLGLEVKKEEIISANYAGVLLIKQLNLKNCKLILRPEAQEDYFDLNKNDNPVEAIVVGDIGSDWNHNLMNELLHDLLNGAELVALHKGRYFQSEGGLTIDAGAFVAGLEYASGVTARVVGKPNPNFFALASTHFNCKPEQIVLVGDDFINDIEGGHTMGYLTIMVKTGKYREALAKKAKVQPHYFLSSIKELPKWLKEKE